MSATHKDKPLGCKDVLANQKPDKKQPHSSANGSHGPTVTLSYFLLLHWNIKVIKKSKRKCHLTLFSLCMVGE